MSHKKSTHVRWEECLVDRHQREQRHAHKAAVLWFTGLSGSGKSSLAQAMSQRLFQNQCREYVLDGDNMRHGLCSDLGFSSEDRLENIRRVGEVSKLFVESGCLVLTAFISPFRADREKVRNLFEEHEFIEIFCDCPLSVCEQRDVKGLYKKARAGTIAEFTGISSPYEVPTDAEIVLKTDNNSVEECIEQILSYLHKAGLFQPE